MLCTSGHPSYYVDIYTIIEVYRLPFFNRASYIQAQLLALDRYHAITTTFDVDILSNLPFPPTALVALKVTAYSSSTSGTRVQLSSPSRLPPRERRTGQGVKRQLVTRRCGCEALKRMLLYKNYRALGRRGDSSEKDT